MTAQTQPAGTPVPAEVIEDVYHRVVELDAALTEVTTVDSELHHWAEQRLGELLAILEPHVAEVPVR